MTKLFMRMGMFIAAVVCVTSGAYAQQSVSGTQVVLIQKGSFGRRDVDAVIRLFNDSTPAVIALRQSVASPELLYTALTALASARARHTGTTAKHVDIVLRSGIQYLPINGDKWAWASKLVGRLQRASQIRVDGVGTVKGLTVTLDDHAPGAD